ncbi:MAG: 3-hydroxyisobutyrate dehydrogenase [Rhodospirillales bacterium]|jgi:3-hydroxyisobutyrate dehydrogenase
MATIGFIGLGNMGGPMAANLVKAGHAVRGFDLSEAARAGAAALGVPVAATLAVAVAGADAVVTMLPAGRHVVGVWTELAGLVAPGTLLIDSSTVDVDSARAAHALAAGRGCPAVDAPVSGGTAGAAAGTLTFMVGGAQDAFAKAESILSAMGRRVVRCGDGGAGQAAKICNNMLLGISMIGACEAFALGEKLGLTHEALYAVLSTSSGQCWSVTSYCPVPGPVPASPANTGYRPGFAAALMSKDLSLARQAAEGAGARTPLGAAAADIYADFAGTDGDRDFSAVIERLR